MTKRFSFSLGESARELIHMISTSVVFKEDGNVEPTRFGRRKPLRQIAPRSADIDNASQLVTISTTEYSRDSKCTSALRSEKVHRLA